MLINFIEFKNGEFLITKKLFKFENEVKPIEDLTKKTIKTGRVDLLKDICKELNFNKNGSVGIRRYCCKSINCNTVNHYIKKCNEILEYLAKDTKNANYYTVEKERINRFKNVLNTLTGYISFNHSWEVSYYLRDFHQEFVCDDDIEHIITEKEIFKYINPNGLILDKNKTIGIIRMASSKDVNDKLLAMKLFGNVNLYQSSLYGYLLALLLYKKASVSKIKRPTEMNDFEFNRKVDLFTSKAKKIMKLLNVEENSHIGGLSFTQIFEFHCIEKDFDLIECKRIVNELKEYLDYEQN